ncbi:putative metal-binding motif-containing protein [Candidatus Woesearchaeota archaeon]|nr:putative metal-binding motif-containing protein [Candidatus Woesearchaeota archaeon]
MRRKLLILTAFVLFIAQASASFNSGSQLCVLASSTQTCSAKCTSINAACGDVCDGSDCFLCEGSAYCSNSGWKGYYCVCACNTGYVPSGTTCKKTNGQTCTSSTECASGCCRDNVCSNTQTYYYDVDNDGYGTSSSRTLCLPSGYYRATQSGDCADSNADRNPGVAEICNIVDDNCDGTINEGCDDDNDNYADSSMTCSGSWMDNGVSRSCSSNGNDCNDGNANIHPGVTDNCNGVDDDCDGSTDEDGGCAINYVCSSGKCVSTLSANGVACTLDSQCTSGNCVYKADGSSKVCCDTSCSSTCKACDSDGVGCVEMGDGKDPRDDCGDCQACYHSSCLFYDSKDGCPAGYSCNGLGECKLDDGQFCNNDPSKCASNVCIGGTCLPVCDSSRDCDGKSTYSGTWYYCTRDGGSWAWRTNNDPDRCTYNKATRIDESCGSYTSCTNICTLSGTSSNYRCSSNECIKETAPCTEPCDDLFYCSGGSCLGGACGTTNCPSDYCSGTMCYKYAATCSRYCSSGSCPSSCTCTPTATYACNSASLCTTFTASSTTYYCTNEGGSYAWRTSDRCGACHKCSSGSCIVDDSEGGCSSDSTCVSGTCKLKDGYYCNNDPNLCASGNCVSGTCVPTCDSSRDCDSISTYGGTRYCTKDGNSWDWRTSSDPDRCIISGTTKIDETECSSYTSCGNICTQSGTKNNYRCSSNVCTVQSVACTNTCDNGFYCSSGSCSSGPCRTSACPADSCSGDTCLDYPSSCNTFCTLGICPSTCACTPITYTCSEANNCQKIIISGTTYYCTNYGGSWAWRTSTASPSCTTNGCYTGSCSSSGTCAVYTSGKHNCGTCKACDSTGTCANVPNGLDNVEDDCPLENCNKGFCNGNGACAAYSDSRQHGCNTCYICSDYDVGCESFEGTPDPDDEVDYCPDTIGTWGSCIRLYSDVCSTAGNKYKTDIVRYCSKGACVNMIYNDIQSCTVNTDGLSCNGGVCVSGSCNNQYDSEKIVCEGKGYTWLPTLPSSNWKSGNPQCVGNDVNANGQRNEYLVYYRIKGVSQQT